MPPQRDIKLFRLLRPNTVELWEHIECSPDSTDDGATILTSSEATVLVLRRCAEVLERTKMVANTKRLGDELLYRESQAPTAIGKGIAIPHVRSKNIRDLIMCFLRYPRGVKMNSLDGEPVFIVFGIATPYFEQDTDYQKVYRKLLSIMQNDPSFRRELMEITTPGEIVRVLRQRE